MLKGQETHDTCVQSRINEILLIAADYSFRSI